MADASRLPYATAMVYPVLQDTLERIEHLRGLVPDWDSYRGIPPSAIAVDVALCLLDLVASSLGPQWGPAIRPYVVVPMHDGGVQIEWRSPSKQIELEINSDGTFGYLLIDIVNGRRFKEADDVPLATALDLVRQVLAAGQPH